MAAKPRRPSWKRPYSWYRLGERKRVDTLEEPQRISLYISARLLELAETLTIQGGAGSVQSYCERLLARAIAAEQSLRRVEAAEAKHGPFEGLRAIADDPEYLAEWKASAQHHRDESAAPPIDAAPPRPLPPGVVSLPIPAYPHAAVEAILRHAGFDGDDPLGFLACLRRGAVPPADTVEELGAALLELHRGIVGAPVVDRRLAHALNRLAIESQVLHTDAWPDAFDDWTVEAIRATQAAVDLILSGATSPYT